MICTVCPSIFPLHWRHNERDCDSNHWHLNCLRSRLSMRRSKKTSKLNVTGLCEGNSPVTGEFPAQKASNAKNASILWLKSLGFPCNGSPRLHHFQWSRDTFFSCFCIEFIFCRCSNPYVWFIVCEAIVIFNNTINARYTKICMRPEVRPTFCQPGLLSEIVTSCAWKCI